MIEGEVSIIDKSKRVCRQLGGVIVGGGVGGGDSCEEKLILRIVEIINDTLF